MLPTKNNVESRPNAKDGNKSDAKMAIRVMLSTKDSDTMMWCYLHIYDDDNKCDAIYQR